LLRSPYLYVGLVVTLICWPFWTETSDNGPAWAQAAIDIVPSLLGFSMGGMAIMLAFSNAAIFSTLTQKGKENSLFLKVIANFFHFILVQTIAILLALIGKSHGGPVLGFLGFWAMTYALLVALATAGQLLRTAEVFNKVGGIMVQTKAPDEKEGE